MRFIGKYSNGLFLTDDYDLDEVLRGVHIQHFREDLKRHHLSSLKIYDENMNFIMKIYR